MESQICFLLTAHGYDTARGFEITLFGKSISNVPIKIIVSDFRPLFFVDAQAPLNFTLLAAERKGLPLKSLEGQAIDCLYFNTHKAMIECSRILRANLIPHFESDVHPTTRYLMERGVFGTYSISGEATQGEKCIVYRNPHVRGVVADIPLTVQSMDIETDADAGTILCIASHGLSDVVFMIGNNTDTTLIRYVPDEKSLLNAYFNLCEKEDPDIIIGWNVIDFDLVTIQKRCDVLDIPFRIGRDGKGRIFPANGQEKKQTTVRIGGRVILDIPVLLRSNFHTFEEYSLDFVSAEILGTHKLITQTGREKINHIKELFKTDKEALAAYNIEDTLLVWRICEKTAILTEAIERCKRSGAELGRGGGSVAAFDYVYLPKLHRAGYVARDILDVSPPPRALSGGYVMESQPGIFENVLILDFKSLYPSLIMTFGIDPLAYATNTHSPQKNPYGTLFNKTTAILPGIIADLMQERSKAKANNNSFQSQAIKILMNSFYGVLGSHGCRFFSYDVAQSITQSGQFVLKKTVEHIEKTTPYSVLYGDTDSLFLLLGKDHTTDAKSIGEKIVADVNSWLTTLLLKEFDATSVLELEFDVHFRNFFMPTIRGSTLGSKKRYCGTVMTKNGLELNFKGLESARSDWTELAKEFQSELYMRIFKGIAYEEYITHIVSAIKTRSLDGKLIYKKKLNKPISEYTTNIPPHVQAAKLLDHPLHHISYVITKNGPQPLEKQTAPLDYDHYIEAQIKPVADAILERIGTSFDQIVSGQTSLLL